jgi:hypothetical protein
MTCVPLRHIVGYTELLQKNASLILGNAPKVFVNDDADGARGIIEAALREREAGYWDSSLTIFLDASIEQLILNQ